MKMDSKLLLMTEIASALGVTLIIVTILLFRIKGERDGLMDLCRIKNRDLDNYAEAQKHDYIKLVRTEEHLKDAQADEKANFRVAVWLYDYIWSETFDTEHELKTLPRSERLWNRICKDVDRGNFEAVMKYHNNLIDEGGI